MSRGWLMVAALLLVTGCVSHQETADWATYHSEEFHFSFKYPSSWAISEGPMRISRVHAAAVSLNNLSAPGFWVTIQQTSPTSWEYSGRTVLNQLQPGAVYFEVGWRSGGPPAPLEFYAPEMEANDLSLVRRGVSWDSWDSDPLRRYYLTFSKWGRLWEIWAYLVEPVDEADREDIELVLDSFRFDPIPVGDERWAIAQAKKHLPEWSKPD